jgi:hypothetical protein
MMTVEEAAKQPSYEETLQNPSLKRYVRAWELFNFIRSGEENPFLKWFLETHDMVILEYQTGEGEPFRVPWILCSLCKLGFSTLSRIPGTDIFSCYPCRKEVLKEKGLCGLCAGEYLRLDDSDDFCCRICEANWKFLAATEKGEQV